LTIFLYIQKSTLAIEPTPDAQARDGGGPRRASSFPLLHRPATRLAIRYPTLESEKAGLVLFLLKKKEQKDVKVTIETLTVRVETRRRYQHRLADAIAADARRLGPSSPPSSDRTQRERKGFPQGEELSS
jgi:hypothetical protein